MKKCQNCGFEVKDEAKFCPECGSEIIEEVEVTEEADVPDVPDEVEVTEEADVPDVADEADVADEVEVTDLVEVTEEGPKNVCPECGQEIEEGMKFCRNCGSKINQEQGEAKKTKFCSNCGFEMDINTKFCPECGMSTTGQPRPGGNQTVVNPEKSPILALILSFLIIGLGQVYLGLTKKGLILFVLAIVSGILMLVFVGFVLWLLVWLYAMYDGYNSATKMNNGIPVEDTLDLQNLF